MTCFNVSFVAVAALTAAASLITPAVAVAAPDAGGSRGSAATQDAEASAPPPTRSSAEASSSPSPPGKGMAVAGTALIFGSGAGYIAMAVGLGISAKADADVKALGSVSDVERRREVIARGELGNRIALGAGLGALSLMAAGITLVVLGRRRADAARASASAVPVQGGGAFFVTGRF